jgi:hypothetical protein
MQIEESPARKVGKLAPQPRHRANTRFARMIAACGLSHVEAAGFLGISKQAVAMKAAGMRPLFRDEEVKLIELWETVMQQGVDKVVMPLGSVRMATAQMELRELATGVARPDSKNS